MQSNGRDIRSVTRVVACGAAPALANGNEVFTDALDLEDPLLFGDGRPHSVSFDLPIEINLAVGATVSCVGRVQKSPDGVEWTDIGPDETLFSVNNDTAAAQDPIRGAIRAGADIIQSDARYLRAAFTPTIPAVPTVVTQRGLSVLLGCPDRTNYIAAEDRKINQ